MKYVNVFACGFCLSGALALYAHGDQLASAVNLCFAIITGIFATVPEKTQ